MRLRFNGDSFKMYSCTLVSGCILLYNLIWVIGDVQMRTRHDKIGAYGKGAAAYVEYRVQVESAEGTGEKN